MKYVSFDNGIESEVDESDVVEITDSHIVEGELDLTVIEATGHYFKIKLTKEETLMVGKSYFMEAANKLPPGMRDSFVKQLTG